MSLRIEYHELVDTDLEHAWPWYEDQDRSLGDRALEAVLATVVRASRWPNASSPVLRDDRDEIVERKLPAHGFPDAVRYRILDDDRLALTFDPPRGPLRPQRSSRAGSLMPMWQHQRSAAVSCNSSPSRIAIS